MDLSYIFCRLNQWYADKTKAPTMSTKLNAKYMPILFRPVISLNIKIPNKPLTSKPHCCSGPATANPIGLMARMHITLPNCQIIPATIPGQISLIRNGKLGFDSPAKHTKYSGVMTTAARIAPVPKENKPSSPFKFPSALGTNMEPPMIPVSSANEMPMTRSFLS